MDLILESTPEMLATVTRGCVVAVPIYAVSYERRGGCIVVTCGDR